MQIERPDRPPIYQVFYPRPLVVPATPANVCIGSVFQQGAIDLLITSFAVSCPLGGANSIWIGDSSVDSAQFNGVEVVPGSTKTFAVNNERQLYELQEPLLMLQQCELQGVAIPITVWNLSTLYASATAQITVGITFYQEMFK